jgi:hypothetical protein
LDVEADGAHSAMLPYMKDGALTLDKHWREHLKPAGIIANDALVLMRPPVVARLRSRLSSFAVAFTAITLALLF